MISKKSPGNVFKDIGFGREEAENLRIRAFLMAEIEQYIKREKISQSTAAKIFGVTQPRISDLISGKIELFSVDILIEMLSKAGMKLRIHVIRAKAA